MAESYGYIRTSKLGYSGIVFTTDGPDDGAIKSVAPGSPAAAAGFQPRDVLVSVNDKAVAPTPGTVAGWRMFGAKGDTIRIKTERAGTPNDISLVLAQAAPPPNMLKGSLLIQVVNLVDYEGQLTPCMGAGVLSGVALAACYKKFKDSGFIKASELGTTGLTVDTTSADKAIVSAVAAGSPAAAGGVQPGDRILEVQGKPLTWSLGEASNEALFGRQGTAFRVVVHRADGDTTLALTLGTKADAGKDE